MKIIEPSLLSIDKSKASEQLKTIKKLGLSLIHYDVMDGKFVPPTSFTTQYLRELEDLKIQFNIHLMVTDPIIWIEKYKDYKAKSIIFHAETQTTDEARKIIEKIHGYGFLAGISVKPNTDLNKYQDLFSVCDIILIMSVEPGWGGQSFVLNALDNLNKANIAKKKNNKLIIEIDGGINFEYIKKLYNQVDWFVTGSWFFKNLETMQEYLEDFKKLK